MLPSVNISKMWKYNSYLDVQQYLTTFVNFLSGTKIISHTKNLHEVLLKMLELYGSLGILPRTRLTAWTITTLPKPTPVAVTLWFYHLLISFILATSFSLSVNWLAGSAGRSCVRWVTRWLELTLQLNQILNMWLYRKGGKWPKFSWTKGQLDFMNIAQSFLESLRKFRRSGEIHPQVRKIYSLLLNFLLSQILIVVFLLTFI